MGAYAWNPNPWEAEVGGYEFPGQLYSKTLPQTSSK